MARGRGAWDGDVGWAHAADRRTGGQSQRPARRVYPYQCADRSDRARYCRVTTRLCACASNRRNPDGGVPRQYQKPGHGAGCHRVGGDRPASTNRDLAAQDLCRGSFLRATGCRRHERAAVAIMTFHGLHDVLPYLGARRVAMRRAPTRYRRYVRVVMNRLLACPHAASRPSGCCPRDACCRLVPHNPWAYQ